MKRIHLLLALLLLQSIFLLRADAQEARISLPDARAGANYKLSLPLTLGKQGLSFASGSRKVVAQWARAGRLPPGLRLEQDGTLHGALGGDSSRATPYTFKVQVTDADEPDSEPLVLDLSLKVLPAKIRLVSAGSVAPAPSDDDDEEEVAANGDGDDDAEKPPKKSQAVCGKTGITIETATIVRSEVIPINVKIDDGKKAAVKTLDVTVRGAGDVRDALKPVPVAAASSVPLDITFKTEGDNVISVNALDKDNRLVACAETTVKFAPVPVDEKARVTATLGKNFTLLEESTHELPVVLGGDTALVDKLRFSVRDDKNNEVDSGTSFVTPGEKDQRVVVRLKPRRNNITIWGLDSKDNRVTNVERILIDCEGLCADGRQAAAAGDPTVEIDPPNFRVFDQPDTKVKVVITNNNGRTDAARRVERLYYRVTDAKGFDVDSGIVDVHRDNVTEVSTSVPLVVPLARSENGAESVNTITVFGLNANTREPVQLTNTAAATVVCRDCNGPSTRLTGDSIYTRAIVGFEQAGASSAESSQKPFLDFFFGAPVGRRARDVAPRTMLWGNVRFASFPQQNGPSNLSGLTSGFLDTFAAVQPNKLVQSFDFLAGVDVRVVPLNDKGYFSLMPGTRQKTSLSLIASLGAISPLSTSRDQAELFAAVPQKDGKTDPDFLKLFPGAENKKNIAFVNPIRDRFFRQFYGGVRVKTFFYDKHNEIINRFPAIIDFSLGRNEAVTGNLKDWVFKLEGFYPFPFKEASFFYLYGTALMKIGGKHQVTLPIFLKPPTEGASLSDPDTLIVPVDSNPFLRSTRDSYRLGVGVNLIELINKLRTPAPAPR